jgi:hypothetical protein
MIHLKAHFSVNKKFSAVNARSPLIKCFRDCWWKSGPKVDTDTTAPLKALPSSEGVTTEGPLRDGWKALSLLLPSLSRPLLPSNYFYLYFYHRYF